MMGEERLTLALGHHPLACYFYVRHSKSSLQDEFPRSKATRGSRDDGTLKQKNRQWKKLMMRWTNEEVICSKAFWSDHSTNSSVKIHTNHNVRGAGREENTCPLQCMIESLNKVVYSERYVSSFADKWDSMKKMCEELGVIVKPKQIEGVWICPILSWYHASWDTEPEIQGSTAIEKVSLLRSSLLGLTSFALHHCCLQCRLSIWQLPQSTIS